MTRFTGTIPPPGSPRCARESADAERWSPMTQSLSGGTITCVDETGRPTDRRSFQLPDEYRLEQLWLPDRKVLDGQATVACSSHGQTPSYALQVIDSEKDSQWLLIVGLTGQTLKIEDEEELEAIFAMLNPSWRDLD